VNDEPATDATMVESPGRALKAAREAANISVEAMAHQLNWLNSYVVAIEEDQYGAFSNATFAKGYLKSYARRLGLEEQALLDGYEQLVVGKTPDSRHAVETNVPTLHKSGIGKYIGLIIFLLVIAVLWMAKGSENLEQGNGVISTASDVPPGEVVSAAVESSIQSQVRSGLNQPTEAMQSDEDNSIEELVRDVAEVADQLKEDAEYSDATVEQSMFSAPGEEALKFSFSDECWLEVRDANGDLIYADLRRGGDKISITGLPPFEILVGHAEVVKLRYRNEIVPLQADSGRNSVRMRIGE